MLVLLVAAVMAQQVSVKIVDRPSVGDLNTFYVSNRTPIDPQPFRKLPIKTIRPEGWLLRQLQLEANGFTGHLTEISEYLNKKNNAWLSPTGEGDHGWEEVPYWLKGFADLGYILQDPRILKETDFWVQSILKNQAEDGWLGPRANLKANNGKPDMWPNMVMLNVLQSYYDYSGDKRVLEVMTRYFKWQDAQPDEEFLLSYWEKQRGGDNLASVYWLYNRTGDEFLINLARKIHRRTADWCSGIPDFHGVNFAQAFREPAEFSLLDSKAATVQQSEADYDKMRQMYGQVPGGMYGADENARPGFTDPRQATETCAMAEMMLSTEMLLAQTGDPVWAERCEDVAFNSLPASMTPDLKALHYLTSPNMVECDAGSKAPELQNSGPMLLFNPWDHRCCQHNVSHAWPYFSENLWYGTDENGLAAAIYAPCKVTAGVDFNQTVSIEEKTQYPFNDTVEFHFSMDAPVRFPLTLRIPAWCEGAQLNLNGHALLVAKEPRGKYAVVETEWKSGDVLTLTLPMAIEINHWVNNENAVSIQRGPLTYALKIGEKYVRHGGTDAWPAYSLEPTTPWNYGLTLDHFEVVSKPWPTNGQPFDWDSSPVEIKTWGRPIPEWKMDGLGLVGKLEPSPVLTKDKAQPITLIPMGAARLRISSFPVASILEGKSWAER